MANNNTISPLVAMYVFPILNNEMDVLDVPELMRDRVAEALENEQQWVDYYSINLLNGNIRENGVPLALKETVLGIVEGQTTNINLHVADIIDGKKTLADVFPESIRERVGAE